jgi:hypothetical protein
LNVLQACGAARVAHSARKQLLFASAPPAGANQALSESESAVATGSLVCGAAAACGVLALGPPVYSALGPDGRLHAADPPHVAGH